MKKLNWIDYLVIVILAGALIFGAVKIISGMVEKEEPIHTTESTENNESQEPTETTEPEDKNPLTEPDVRMVVEVPEISVELAENVIASFDLPAVEIDGSFADMTRIYNGNKLVDAQITDWEIVESEGKETVALRFTVEANATWSKGSYSIGTQEIRIGKEHIIKTISMELNGYILDLTELDQ